MSPDRWFDQESLEQALLFESAIGDLNKPLPSGVDIENALHSLSGLQSLQPNQAKTILNLVRHNVQLWLKAADAGAVVNALALPLATYGRYVESQPDETERQAHADTAKEILTAVIVSEPDVYRETVAPAIERGRFGNIGPVMVGVLKGLFSTVESGKSIWGDAEIDCENLALMLRDATRQGNQAVMDELLPSIPITFFYANMDTVTKALPKIKGVIETAVRVQSSDVEQLTARYVYSTEEARDFLRRRIMEGSFGDPIATVDKMISLLTIKEGVSRLYDPEEISEATEDLWLDILDLDKERKDPRLKAVREKVMGQAWYWEADGAPNEAVYTIVEALQGMGIPVGEEERFMSRYGDVILEALRHNLVSRAEEDGLRIPETGEDNSVLKVRLAKIVGALREWEDSSEQELFRSFPDRLLAVSLYPLQDRSKK